MHAGIPGIRRRPIEEPQKCLKCRAAEWTCKWSEVDGNDLKRNIRKQWSPHHYGRITWSRFSQSTTTAASSFRPHFLITLLASLAPLAPRSSSSWLARAKFKDLCSMVVARGNSSSSSSFPRFSQFNYTSTMCQHMLCDSQVPRHTVRGSNYGGVLEMMNDDLLNGLWVYLWSKSVLSWETQERI